MPLESFMRRKLHASLSPSPSLPSSPSSCASEARSSAHSSGVAKSRDSLEASAALQSALETAAAEAAASDECRELDPEPEDCGSQGSREYEVLCYQTHEGSAQDDEKGNTGDCIPREEDSYTELASGETCPVALQHLSARISDAKARHCQQVAEVSAEIDKMRTALKRYIDGLMDQLHRDFVADPDAAQVASLDQLQEQCAKLQHSKRKIAQMGAMWEKKAKLIRQT